MFDFPNSPTNGQIVNTPGGSYTWDGAKWAPTGATGGVVTAFNTRQGAVSLTSGDVTSALTYTPLAPSALTPYAPLASPSLSGSPTAPTQTSTDNSTKLATTAFVQSVSAAAGTANVGRNLLHNPLFLVAQRGTGPFTVFNDHVGSLDRWTFFGNADTASLTRIALTDADRAAIGDEAATFAAQNVFTGTGSPASSAHWLSQAIEDVYRLAGKSVTFSFWAKGSAAGLNLGVNFYQDFGSGGSTGVTSAGVLVPISTTWARYSGTIVIPSVSGKTVGANNFTKLTIAYSSGSVFSAGFGGLGVQSGTVQLWGCQVEVGSITILDKPDPATDLAKCMRFYQIGQLMLTGVASGATQVFSISVPPPVPPRTSSAIMTITTNGLTGTIGSPVLTYNGYSFNLQGTTTGSGAFNLNAVFSATADL